eukprot:TRINITY_DN89_c0_g1_i9.p1 TRINITY_DN89_c0_g1~~TRINITY_DN89_c0_g1_i9.p1  ORF type:complete len:205 (-),score=36.84 TRINITY_DN89_c0_g1_i9:160-774(-)
MPHMMGMILKISAPTSFVAARAPPPPLALLLVALTLAATCANFSSTETGEDRTLPEAAMGFSPAKLAIRATALGDDLQATRAPLPAALQTGEHSPAESVTDVAIATGTSCCCPSLPLTAAHCRKPRHWEEEGEGKGGGRGGGERGKRRDGYGQWLAKVKTGRVVLCLPQPYFDRLLFLLSLSLPPLSLSLSLSLPVSVPLHSHK